MITQHRRGDQTDPHVSVKGKRRNSLIPLIHSVLMNENRFDLYCPEKNVNPNSPIIDVEGNLRGVGCYIAE